MKSVFIIFSLFFSLSSFAHKDKYYRYGFGSVDIVLRTSFPSLEGENARIIGRYAAELANKHGFNYNNKIQINLSQVYHYPNETEEERVVFKYEHTSNIQVYSDSVEILVNGQKYRVKDEKHRNKIIINDFDSHFDITKTLQLIEYAIVNESNLKEQTKTKTKFNPSNSKALKFIYKVFDFKELPFSKTDKLSKQIQESLKLEMDFNLEFDDIEKRTQGLKIIIKNGKYFISNYEEEITILESLYQVIIVNNSATYNDWYFIFSTPQSFVCFNRFDKEKSIAMKKFEISDLPSYHYDINIFQTDKRQFILKHNSRLYYQTTNIALLDMSTHVLKSDFKNVIDKTLLLKKQ